MKCRSNRITQRFIRIKKLYPIQRAQIRQWENAYFYRFCKSFIYRWYKKIGQKKTPTSTQGNKITNKIVFDSSPRNGALPTRLKVSNLIDGFSTALQHMREGDRWEVWIPWRLGYGSTDYGNIPAYTTLVFEIELLEVIEN